MMKKLALTVAISASLLAAMPAAQAESDQMPQFGTVLKLAAEMNLTPTQRQKARPIIRDGILERLAILQNAGFKRGQLPSLEQMAIVSEPILASRKKTEMQLSNIFSQDQLAIYRVLAREIRAKILHHRQSN